jgi:hypothetical protein
MMEVDMKVNGRIIKRKEKELIFTLVEIDMKVNGRMV